MVFGCFKQAEIINAQGELSPVMFLYALEATLEVFLNNTYLALLDSGASFCLPMIKRKMHNQK